MKLTLLRGKMHSINPIAFIAVSVLIIPMIALSSCSILMGPQPVLSWSVLDGTGVGEQKAAAGSRIGMELLSPDEEVPQLIHWHIRSPGSDDFVPLEEMNTGIYGPKTIIYLLLNSEGRYDVMAKYSFSSNTNLEEPVFEGSVTTSVDVAYHDTGEFGFEGSPAHRNLSQFTGSYSFQGQTGGGTPLSVDFQLQGQRVSEVFSMGATSEQMSILLLKGIADIDVNEGNETSFGVDMYAASYIQGNIGEKAEGEIVVYIPLEPDADLPSFPPNSMLLLRLSLDEAGPVISKAAIWDKSAGTIDQSAFSYTDLNATYAPPPIEDLYAKLYTERYLELAPDF